MYACRTLQAAAEDCTSHVYKDSDHPIEPKADVIYVVIVAHLQGAEQPISLGHILAIVN